VPNILSVEAVRAAMLGVIDPELGDNVVDLGMYHAADIDSDGNVVVHLALTTAGCPLRAQLKSDTEARVGSIPGVRSVKVKMTEMTREEKGTLMAQARWKARENAPATDIPGRTRVVAISSGKGGVGKSSVTVNLAAALAYRGYTVGVLDADIAGFSVPRMLGMEGQISAEHNEVDPQRPKMRPIEKRIGAGLLKVLSMGFLSPEDEAIMWRGLMLNRAVQHFLEDALWGDLDYLLVDMPPGTGDIQMGLARMLPRTEMIIVTTPALAAQKVAVRAADMARKGYLRVAGVVENMSGFECDHGVRYDLFGTGGGDRLAAEIGAPLLGRIPLEAAVSAGGDIGAPASLGRGPIADAFAALADAVLMAIPVVEMHDCTARLFEQVEATLGPKPPAPAATTV
jgi:ATP-binding protein involved in chromosome partitioning